MFRILSSFIGFMLAVVVSIIIFAPDRIPAGWGFEDVPVEVNVGSNLGGELISALTGKSDKNVRIKNIHNKPLYNLQVTLYNDNMKVKKQFIKQILGINSVLTLGWAEEWDIQSGDKVSVSAAAYQSVEWAL